MTTSNPNVRIERDSMGQMEVPADALYGASTMRAVLNFPISDLRFPRTFIRALGLVKQSAARTNMSLGVLDETLGNAIVEAAQEVIDGRFDSHFVLDVFQTGFRHLDQHQCQRSNRQPGIPDYGRRPGFPPGAPQ